MRTWLVESIYFGATISIVGYGIGLFLQKRFQSSKLRPFVNPLLISILLVIVGLHIFRVSYEEYESTAKYLSYLLTPATVALAVPLYQKIQILKKYAGAVLVSIFTGVLSSVLSIFLMSVLFDVSHEVYVTMLPKSITTAIGMGVSEELGGVVSITVASIILTGILGNVIAETVCRVFHITDPIAKGLAIGTAAHAIGTAKAMELGEMEGAMSSLSIVVSGLFTVALAPVFATLL